MQLISNAEVLGVLNSLPSWVNRDDAEVFFNRQQHVANTERSYHLHIEQDEYADDPRSWDNVTTMACTHRRYRLGDDDTGYNAGDYNSWADMREVIEADNDVLIIKPLYLYDHSGITISTSPFSCGWDSGQIGWVYITRDQWQSIMQSDPTPEKLDSVLEAEVKTYDQYLTGDVYHFTLEDDIGNDIDSCSGFYGSDPIENGMLDHLPAEYRDNLTIHPPYGEPYKLGEVKPC